ncbi:MAG: hypothetical protein K8R18_02830 [Parvibaculum sp.]|uniref:hypothetical protein n=1 Tax=Parvibaculum sp. TaxID=2024848 RepID=UPI0025D6FCAD|nr:hypothetical protein [Parvibaculum sp.]MCE9648537.1 hypothetical protein [Parvibaculum sp.]
MARHLITEDNALAVGPYAAGLKATRRDDLEAARFRRFIAAGCDDFSIGKMLNHAHPAQTVDRLAIAVGKKARPLENGTDDSKLTLFTHDTAPGLIERSADSASSDARQNAFRKLHRRVAFDCQKTDNWSEIFSWPTQCARRDNRGNATVRTKFPILKIHFEPECEM